MNKKTAGFIHIFLVTLIAAIGIGTVGYFAYKNGQIKLPGSSINQPTPSSSEPTPFSKYYNGRVSFEYPSTWSIDESRADQEYNGDITLKKHWAEIRIKLNREGFDAYPQPTEFEEVYLDKIKMYKYQRNDYYGSSKIIGVTNNDKNSKGLIDLNGVLYTIELTYPNTVSSLQTDTPESIEHEFDQILSSFKFLDKKTDYKTLCEDNEGTWLAEYNECESMQSGKGLNKEQCESVNGKFNECDSACRHKPESEVCISVCVGVCKF